MVNPPTPNYGFFLPEGSDSMADVVKNLNNNFKKMELRNDITVISAGGALPQSGTYNVGDRVFRDDPNGTGTYPSNYILVCKDANWGWHWRPIQAAISPWVSVPATALDNAGFSIHPTYKFQIALDSRGLCHWRGVIRSNTPGIVASTSIVLLKFIPDGLRPNGSSMHTTAISPVTGAAGKAGYVGGRMFVRPDGYTSFRFFNTNNGLSQNIWLDGFFYANSLGYYYGA